MTAEEAIQVEVLGSYNSKGEIDLEDLNTNLIKNLKGIKYDSNELSESNKIKNLPAVVEYNGYSIVIAEDGVTATQASVEVGKEVTKTEKYNYSDGVNVATVPKGFIVSETDKKIDTGLVVKAPDGSEFVWVPVPTVVSPSEGAGTKNKAMAILKDGHYRGLLYDFEGENSTIKSGCTTTATDFREPAYLSDETSGDASTHNNNIVTEDGLQEEYDNMIRGIIKYGGFYVGRYETSLNETKVQSKNGQTSMDATVSSGNRWYGMYEKQINYASDNEIEDIVGSSMIWGSQYDAMLNWMLKGSEASKVTTEKIPQHPKTTTGSTEGDVINNIYDLGNNLAEWTLEACGTKVRLLRGGNCNNYFTSSFRFDHYPVDSHDSSGSRLTLYIR